MTTIYEICSEKIQEAMERDKIDGSLEVNKIKVVC